MKVLIRIVAAIALGLLLAPTPAEAHVRSTTGFSEISQHDGQVRYALSLEFDLLAATLGLGQNALDAADDEERVAVLAASEQRIGSYVGDNLRLFLDGVQCESAVEDTGVESREGMSYAVVTTSYSCPGPAGGGYTVAYGVFSDAESVVDDHTNIVDYDLGGHRGRVVLDAGHRAFTTGSGGLLGSTSRFVKLGSEHIFAGIDHLLFVVALLLGARSVTSVVKVASAFTVAHSVTLALAVLGWVEVPSEIVEPLIALSIAYVAAENLLGGASPHRVVVVFGFGLLHGLGFASGLQLTGGMSWTVVSSLVGFNVGVELGQGLLIAVLFPTLLALRRLQWAPLAHAGATSVVAVVGLTWFFQRLTFT